MENDEIEAARTAIEAVGGTLLSMSGGLTPQPGVAEQPRVTMEQWQVHRIPSGDLHLVGWCPERDQGRCSTPIVAFDARDESFMTQSGRLYLLNGPWGSSSHARYVWGRFLTARDIHGEVEVTQEYAALIAAVHGTERERAAARTLYRETREKREKREARARERAKTQPAPR